MATIERKLSVEMARGTLWNPWTLSDDAGRYTSINGQVQPELIASVGRFERWRLIHAGIRERVRL